MQTVALHLLLLLLQTGQPPAKEQVTSAEKTALANRLKIRTAHAVLRRQYESFRDPSDNRRSEATVWMDGDRLRNDYVDYYPGLGEQTGRRYIECLNCERPGHHLTYPEVPHMGGRLEPRRGAKFKTVNPTFDPRLIGYVPDSYGILRHARLDSYVGRPDRTNVRPTRETLDGVDCEVVRYTQGMVVTSIWFDPKRGYHPIKFALEQETPQPDRAFRQYVVVDLQAVGNGLWFPRSTRYTRYTGERLDEQETVEVAAVRVNEPIPTETFALRGMGIADGTHFSVVGTREREWVWRGGTLVSWESEQAKRAEQGLISPPEPVPLVPSSGPRYWLYAVAIGLAVAAVFFLRRAVRRPRLA